MALDPNLLIPSTSVIRVEMSIAYVPLMAFYMKNVITKANGTSAIGITMPKTAYGRVRQGSIVPVQTAESQTFVIAQSFTYLWGTTLSE